MCDYKCVCVNAVETSLSVAIKTQNLRIVTHEKEKKKNEIISVAVAAAQSIAIE